MKTRSVVVAAVVAMLVFSGLAFVLGYQTGRNRGYGEAMVASRQLVGANVANTSPVLSTPPIAEPSPEVATALPSPVSAAPENSQANMAKPAPLVASAPAAPAVSPYTHVKVLVVGTNQGGEGRTPLVYAEQEAQDVAALLVERYGFEVTRLIGRDATAAAIRSNLKSLLATLGENDDFIFFFAGHGATLEPAASSGAVSPEKLPGAVKRTGLMLAWDAAGATAPKDAQMAGALVADDLIAALKDSPGRHRLAIISSCFSGWATDVDGRSSSENFATPNLDRSQPLAHRTVQVMTASLATERTYEIPELKGSAFTGALRTQLAQDRSQRVLTVFAAVDDLLRTQKLYQPPGGRGSQPQLRSYQPSTGDFYFIPPKDYADWSTTDAIGVGTGPEAMYAQDVTDLEAQDQIKQLQSAPVPAAADAAAPAAPVIEPAKLARYEARASVGDPQAMAILTEYYGRSGNVADQTLAYNYAYSAFETGDHYGKFALGRAYHEGFGVKRNDALGTTLIDSSGLKDLIALLVAVQGARRDLDVLTGKGSATQKIGAAEKVAKTIGGVLTGPGKSLANVFRRGDPVKKTRDNLAAARKALTASNVDITGARSRFTAIRNDITRAKKMSADEKKPFLDAMDSLDQLCSGETPDVPGAIKVIDAMLATGDKSG